VLIIVVVIVVVVTVTGPTPLRLYGIYLIEWNRTINTFRNILSLLKVKFTLQPATKSQRWSRNVALHLL